MYTWKGRNPHAGDLNSAYQVGEILEGSLILSFPPLSSPLLSPPVFHLCASVDHQFPLSFFYPSFFFLSFLHLCVCVYFFFFSLPRPPHPDCVRVVRGSFQFPLLRATSDFEVSSISTRCFHSRSLFFFRRFFPGLRTYYFLCLFLVLRAPPFDLDGGRRRYLQRSWSEGILNVCGGNLRFDLFLSGDIFVILLLILRGLFLS